MKFCGEIVYTRYSDEYPDGIPVHSDICFNCGADDNDGEKPLTDEIRKFFHDNLDEWLDKGNGQGVFWVGDPDYFTNWGESNVIVWGDNV